jgi:tryptophan 2,3-dioxygenase
MSQLPPERPGALNLPGVSRIDLSDEPVHWDLGGSRSYGQYLGLDKLLAAQQPVSVEHDEMLFIIVHQTSELWMRLFLHELDAVLQHVRRDELLPSFRLLRRITAVQIQMRNIWEVLATMSPADYSAFRNALGRSSGFQSWQYRLMEFRLGNKNADMIRVHQGDPEVHATLNRALQAPSLYDEVLRLLSRRGYGIPPELLDRDFTEPYLANKTVAGAWLAIYHNAGKDFELYELAERMVDLDHQFQLWRFHHMKTVERIIGHKPGTGGTGGVSYLTKALELRLFPELWQVRTAL